VLPIVPMPTITFASGESWMSPRSVTTPSGRSPSGQQIGVTSSCGEETRDGPTAEGRLRRLTSGAPAVHQEVAARRAVKCFNRTLR
jgi:hypothetical protein